MCSCYFILRLAFASPIQRNSPPLPQLFQISNTLLYVYVTETRKYFCPNIDWAFVMGVLYYVNFKCLLFLQ
jgi:hypothetical protein